jgi:uncharacterized Fe-S cluster-containing radical SAM superfamily protein
VTLDRTVKHDVRQIALEIYGGCNYDCIMCPQSTGRHKGFLKKIPYDVFAKVVEDGRRHGCQVVSLHGSGEATLHPEMPRFVRLVKDLGMQCITVTNGYRLDERLSRALIEAGLDTIRVSGIGYDRETYLQWMKTDAFDLVRENVIRYRKLNEDMGGKSGIRLYHLVLDPRQMEREVELYRRNWVDHCGVEAEIWMMHNWAGAYEDIPYTRRAERRRTCGRPRAPYLNVRAGGLDGHSAAVVPCCFVLGRDEQAVLGHLDTQSIDEVLSSPAYEELRSKHDSGDFDAVPYCKDCDQLYDVPESLVWTNIPGKAYGQSKVLQDLDYRQWTG